MDSTHKGVLKSDDFFNNPGRLSMSEYVPRLVEDVFYFESGRQTPSTDTKYAPTIRPSDS